MIISLADFYYLSSQGNPVRRFQLKSYLIIGLTIALSACASLPDEKSAQSRAEQVSQSKHSANDILQRAKLSLKKSDSESLSFYAPSYQKKASDAFNKAQSLYANNAEPSEIKLHAQLASEFINAGIRNKKVVKDTLKKSLNNRSILKELSAQKYFPEEFSALESEQINLIQSIEQRDLKGAKQAEKNLINKMHSLEVKAINYAYLANTHTMLKQAQDIHAEKLMPRTYQQTLDSLADAQQFIRQNPRQELRIEELAQASLFQAERLYSLTRHAKQIQVAQDNQLEQFVLKQEEQLQRINQGFKQKDIRNLSFNDQSILLKQYAESNLEDINTYQSKSGKVSKAQLDKWKRKTVLLQGEVRRLQKALKKAQSRN